MSLGRIGRRAVCATMLGITLGHGDVSGQFELGTALNGFVDYPEAFRDGTSYCEARAAGLTVSGAARFLDLVAIELDNTVTFGVGDESCDFPLLAPLPPDTPYQRLRYSPAIAGLSLAASTLSFVLEPWADAPVSPRAKVGGGLLWDKELGSWHFGAGIRYRFGRHSFITDLEAWHLTVEPFLDTLIVPSSTGREQLLDQELIQEEYRPVIGRVAWRVAVR